MRETWKTCKHAQQEHTFVQTTQDVAKQDTFVEQEQMDVVPISVVLRVHQAPVAAAVAVVAAVVAALTLLALPVLISGCCTSGYVCGTGSNNCAYNKCCKNTYSSAASTLAVPLFAFFVSFVVGAVIAM